MKRKDIIHFASVIIGFIVAYLATYRFDFLDLTVREYNKVESQFVVIFTLTWLACDWLGSKIFRR